MLHLGCRTVRIKQGYFLQLRQSNQPRAHAVIDIVCVVSNLVGQIAQLRLQARPLIAQEAGTNTIGLLTLQPQSMSARAVFENPFSGLECEIESVIQRVSFFQLVHHSQALQVVFKASKVGHTAIQGVLPRMPERGMPQVVG